MGIAAKKQDFTEILKYTKIYTMKFFYYQIDFLQDFRFWYFISF